MRSRRSIVAQMVFEASPVVAGAGLFFVLGLYAGISVTTLLALFGFFTLLCVPGIIEEYIDRRR